MKILFAVNNDNVSEAIVKKYQKEYKEILSYKNVYYFNAILRELQKDKSYSRIVISEDLEPFANNNYDSIDKFLYEKYSGISEEAKGINNEKIDIILICADRRKKTDNMLAKIYKKEIYNAIIGQDRSIDEVCKLIYRPKDKEAAKLYYGIRESELGESESENSVSEAEVENIRAHYARLGKNEDKYVESFNNIVAQYTDTQLKIIIKYLPINVKAVLEEKSAKYQQLALTSNLNNFDAKRKTTKYKEQIRQKDEEEEDDELVEQLIKPKTRIKDVVIPTNLTTNNVQKVVVPKINKPQIDTSIFQNSIIEEKEEKEEEPLISQEKIKSINLFEEPAEENEAEKVAIENNTEVIENKTEEAQTQKRGRGRPRKNPIPEVQEEKPKRGRGRPRKNPVEQPVEKLQTVETEQVNPQPTAEKQEIDLFEIEEAPKKQDTELDLFNLEEDKQEQEKAQEPEIDLFDMSQDEPEEEEEEIDLFNMEDENEVQEEPETDLFNLAQTVTPEPEKINTITSEGRREEIQIPIMPKMEEETTNIVKTNNISTNINTLLTADKKIVAFVGTTKNGTSFIVNNTAEMLSSMGIDTAILDMTKSKNAYYIYTNNEESLRNIARNCMENLQKGIAEGIKINKNLTVYTEMPGEARDYDIENILATLLNRHSAVLIDTDFDTSPEIFASVQEIYLVQTMDVLTIQPLTAFLRNLKSKDILKPEKLKIVINKSERVRSLSIKTLIGGMSCYNSPSMTYMTELFNKDNIPYCEIPFEVQNYVKYLDSLVNCSISLNGYTKQFMAALKQLANMVYPLVNKQNNFQRQDRRDPFSSQTNSTLNKMRNRY